MRMRKVDEGKQLSLASYAKETSYFQMIMPLIIIEHLRLLVGLFVLKSSTTQNLLTSSKNIATSINICMPKGKGLNYVI